MSKQQVALSWSRRDKSLTLRGETTTFADISELLSKDINCSNGIDIFCEFKSSGATCIIKCYSKVRFLQMKKELKRKLK